MSEFMMGQIKFFTHRSFSTFVGGERGGAKTPTESVFLLNNPDVGKVFKIIQGVLKLGAY
jgi:hypothetical protein